MRNKIEKYNHWLLKQDIAKLNAGLFCGKIGLCIYWFLQASFFRNREYKRKAEEILDIIYDAKFQNSTFDFENGIIGIALALNFLIDQKNGRGKS